jgi:ornithine cyclodeaminase
MRAITGAELRSVLHHRMLIERLRQTYRSRPECPPAQEYTVATWGEHDASLRLTPVWAVGRSIGVRVATRFPDNPAKDLPASQGVYLLMDGKTGVPRAFVDGPALDRRRAAATSALAATYLARPDSERMLVVGTGALALELVEAYTAVLPVRHVLVWGRDPAKAQKLAKRFHRPRFRIQATDDLEGAVRGAHIIACGTSATAPLIAGPWLQPGQHLDLTGGVGPDMREADDECVGRSRIFVDSRDGPVMQTGDIATPLASGGLSADDIAGDLFELTRGERAGRRFYEQITLFKSAGSALADLTAADMAVEMAIHNDTIR